MPTSKGLRPTSPVHVHVDDDIPVHVHVKQPKKKKLGVTSSKKFQKSTISSRARSKSPSSGPWVPPPAKATKGSKVSWQKWMNESLTACTLTVALFSVCNSLFDMLVFSMFSKTYLVI
ncbi:hypothetical protein ACF0H5_021770 [Mactra antiquata]